jgi:hypothetical protein
MEDSKATTFLINGEHLQDFDRICEIAEVPRSQALRVAIQYFIAHPVEVYRNSQSRSPTNQLVTVYISEDMHSAIAYGAQQLGISSGQVIRLAADYFIQNWVAVSNEVNRLKNEQAQAVKE